MEQERKRERETVCTRCGEGEREEGRKKSERAKPREKKKWRQREEKKEKQNDRARRGGRWRRKVTRGREARRKREEGSRGGGSHDSDRDLRALSLKVMRALRPPPPISFFLLAERSVAIAYGCVAKKYAVLLAAVGYVPRIPASKPVLHVLA